MKVLIAEDDLTSRTIITAVLKKWGYEVVTATDGRQALDILKHPDSPKLALLDWSMPGLSGVEVCRILREEQSNDSIYAIILTSKSEKKNIVQGLNAGANDYIIKPYDNDELHARINVGRRIIEVQTELEKTKNALIHEAMHDSLTGVYNRKAILNMLSMELSRTKRNTGKLYVGMCDLDHFKSVNDKYGHQTGDEILCGFTKIVQKNLREYDLIGRYGGEEYLIIIPSDRNSDIENVFQRICNTVYESTIPTRSGELAVTVSIGVTPSDGTENVDELLTAADEALYRAKAMSRNCVYYVQ